MSSSLSTSDTGRQRELDCLASWSDRGLAGNPAGGIHPIHYKRKVGRPLCGDRVQVDTSVAPALVTRIMPAGNRFARADARGRKQWIAANIEQACVIVAAEPEPSRDLLHRYLVSCECLDITPVLILQKIDLPHPARDRLRGQLRLFRQLGYRAAEVSVKTGAGLAHLRRLLAGRSNVFTGQSGVGKSSLINALIPDLQLQTRKLSRVTGKGTHVTSAARMYYLPDGGSVIDTPGVWEYSLWRMDPRELAYGFVEFRELLGRCRFRDCPHADTPGCALADAIQDGRISASRYRAYRRLWQEQQRYEAGRNCVKRR